jgi:NAD(P)H dehydrogenase (quinone)
MGMTGTALVVFAHPVPLSFTEAMRDRVLLGLSTAGWTVDEIDLYADSFDPCITAAEIAGHPSPDATIDDHIERLLAATAVVFVHPTWWGGQPAIVKGWLDRVLSRPAGVDAFGSVRRLCVVSSHGSSRTRNAVQGVPGRRITFRLIRAKCHPLARSMFVGFYNNDNSSTEDRAEFLDKVEASIAAFTSGRRRLLPRHR